MRNLKRALSLALAAIMLIGMMAVGTSAASVDGFTDADEITNMQAASVTTAIDIFAGYDDGSFGASDYVTRAQMATIICKILSGSNVNADIFKGVEKFQDLGDAAWAEGFINMCYSMGIIAGTSDTTFDPNRPVKTWEASLMLQRALGWWATNDPANSTISELTVTSKGTVLGMYGDLTLLPTAYLTRNDVAEMVYHTIVDCVPVAYNESFGLYRNASSTSFYSGVEYTYIDTLAYTTFGLVYARDKDAFGRPTTAWGYGKLDAGDIDTDGTIKSNYGVNRLTEKLTTVVDTPVAEYTSTVTGRTLYNDLGLSASTYMDLTIDGKDIYHDVVPSESLLLISRTDTDKDGIKVNHDDDNGTTPVVAITGNGVLTQVYNNPSYDATASISKTNCPYKVVIVNTFAMNVNSAVAAKTGQPAYVTVGKLGYNNNLTYGGAYAYGSDLNSKFETVDFARNDVVLITVAYDDEETEYGIQTMELADYYAGTLTRYSITNGTATLDSATTFDFGMNASRFAHDYAQEGGKLQDDVTIYVDQYGYAVDIQAGVQEANAANYALVTAVDTLKDTLFVENTAGVKLFIPDADGGHMVTATFTWKSGNLNYQTLYALAPVKGETIGSGLRVLVTYTVKDGVYTLTDANANAASKLVTKNNVSEVKANNPSATIGYLDSTSILIVETDHAKDEFYSYVGVANVPTMTASDDHSQWVKNAGSSILGVVYTDYSDSTGPSTDDVIYIVDSYGWNQWVSSAQNNDRGNYVIVSALVNGVLDENFRIAGEEAANGKIIVASELDSDVKSGNPFLGVEYDENGILIDTASASAKYVVGYGYIRFTNEVVGTGNSKVSAIQYTLDKDDPIFVYIDENGQVSTPLPTALEDDVWTRVICSKPNTDGSGEIAWAIVEKIEEQGWTYTHNDLKTFTGLLVISGTDKNGAAVEGSVVVKTDIDELNNTKVGPFTVTGDKATGTLTVIPDVAIDGTPTLSKENTTSTDSTAVTKGADAEKAESSAISAPTNDATKIILHDGTEITSSDVGNGATGSSADGKVDWLFSNDGSTVTLTAHDAGKAGNSLYYTIGTSAVKTNLTGGTDAVGATRQISVSTLAAGYYVVIGDVVYKYTDNLATTFANIGSQTIDDVTLSYDSNKIVIESVAKGDAVNTGTAGYTAVSGVSVVIIQDTASVVAGVAIEH